MNFKCFLISQSKQNISLQRILNSQNKRITLLNCLVQTHHYENHILNLFIPSLVYRICILQLKWGVIITLNV